MFNKIMSILFHDNEVRMYAFNIGPFRLSIWDGLCFNVNCQYGFIYNVNIGPICLTYRRPVDGLNVFEMLNAMFLTLTAVGLIVLTVQSITIIGGF